MKRRGIILFELLLYILLMSVAAAVLLPAVGRMMRTLDILHNSVEMTEQAVFSMDFMTEKIRNTLGRTENSRRGNTFEYRAYNEYKKNAPYRFMIKDEKLKVVLYNGKSQPVTGKTSERKEEIAFKPPEGDKMFHV